MNLTLFIDHERLFHPGFLHHLLNQDSFSRLNVQVGIICAPKPKAKLKDVLQSFKRKFVFVGGIIGCVKIAIRLCKVVVGKYFFKRELFLSVEEVCVKAGVSFFKTKNINSTEVQKKIKEFDTDLLLSFQSQIIKADTLKLPRIGCVNKHAGLLPKYKGVWPVFWTLLNKEKECYVTLHWMNEKIDAGDILCQQAIAIETDDTVFKIYEKIFERLPQIVVKTIQGIEDKTIKEIKNEGLSKYYSFPKARHVKQLVTECKRRVV